MNYDSNSYVFNCILLILLFFCDESKELTDYDTGTDYGVDLVGGKPVSHSHYKHLVFIFWSQDNNLHSCAGSVISRKWVLTAAFCIYNKPKHHQVIVIYDLTKDLMIGDEKSQAPSSLQVIHPKFKTGGSSEYDVALIKLDSKIPKYKVRRFIEVGGPYIHICTSINVGKISIKQIFKNSSILLKFEHEYMELEELPINNCSYAFCSKSVCVLKPTHKYVCTTSILLGFLTRKNFGNIGGPLMCRGKIAGIIANGTDNLTKGGTVFEVFLRATQLSHWIFETKSRYKSTNYNISHALTKFSITNTSFASSKNYVSTETKSRVKRFRFGCLLKKLWSFLYNFFRFK